MKYSLARTLTRWFGVVIGVLLVVILFLGTESALFWVLVVPTAGLCVAYFIIKFRFCRCPHCREMLTDKLEFCPYCKMPLE